MPYLRFSIDEQVFDVDFYVFPQPCNLAMKVCSNVSPEISNVVEDVKAISFWYEPVINRYQDCIPFHDEIKQPISPSPLVLAFIGQLRRTIDVDIPGTAWIP
jgi:hypothetical protein